MDHLCPTLLNPGGSSYDALRDLGNLHACSQELAEIPLCFPRWDYFAAAVTPGQSSVRKGVTGSPVTVLRLQIGLLAHA